LSSRAHPRYAGESPNRLHPKEEVKIRQIEERDKRPSPLYIFETYVSQRCPECFCFLKAKPKGSSKKEWTTHCKHHHCFLINVENGIDRMILERIPTNDPRYLRRNDR